MPRNDDTDPKRKKIIQALRRGDTDGRIKRNFHLSEPQLRGYKAALTRQQNVRQEARDQNVYKKLQGYTEELGVQAGEEYTPGVFISETVLCERLDSSEVSKLVKILDTLFPEQGVKPDNKNYDNGSPTREQASNQRGLPKDEMKKIVIELMKSGVGDKEDYTAIYEDSRLRLAKGASEQELKRNKGRIAAFISHYWMGTYG